MNPAFSISPNLMCPVENTIALGGVPIGIIDAQLAARVIGIPNNNISHKRIYRSNVTFSMYLNMYCLGAASTTAINGACLRYVRTTWFLRK